MQISDITVPKKLREASFTDYVKAAVSSNPALANMSWSQRANVLSKDKAIQQLAKASLQNWNNRVYQMSQAQQRLGQPAQISDTEYKQSLKDYVERVLLQKNIASLDPASQSSVNAAIDRVTTNKDKPAQLEPFFQTLIYTTASARANPNQLPFGAPQVTASPQMTTQQAQQAVQQFFAGGMSTSQQQAMSAFLQQYSGTNSVRSTGNPVTDAMLKQLGFRII